MKVFEYLFDQPIGDTLITDSSGQGNNGQINPVRVGATPAIITSEEVPAGYQFKSLKFSVDDMPPAPAVGAEPDDQLQFLQVPLTASIRNIDSTRSFTVSFWAYHSAAPDPGDNPWNGPRTQAGKKLFCPQHVCGAEAFYLFVRTKNIGASVPVPERGELAFTGDGPEIIEEGGIAKTKLGGVTSSGYHVPINQWVHIAGVLAPPDGFPGARPGWPDGVWRIYVDGILRGELAANEDLADASSLIFPASPLVDIRFGNFRGFNRPLPIEPGANDYAFNGYLTGIRMYDHPQSAGEICQDIQADIGIPDVTLVDPIPGAVLDFGEVVERRTTARSIRIGTRSCAPVELQVSTPALPYGLASDPVIWASPADNISTPAETLIWVTYSAGDFVAGGGVDEDVVQITVPETGQIFNVTTRARVRGRTTTSSVLVLDRSGSMAQNAGVPDVRKIDLLRDAAETYVDAMREGDEIGIVRYNDDAPPPSVALQDVGPDEIPIAGRAAAKEFIRSAELNPSGRTSIGDGIFEASAMLVGSTSDTNAIVVFTDGNENEPRLIEDVAGDLTAQTYAVGLGNPANTSATVLDRIVGNTGGYQLITGELDFDNQLRLHKYFLQTLAGVTNNDIVVDPENTLEGGSVHKIPFNVTEADIDVDVYLTSFNPAVIDFSLVSPAGDIINTGNVGTHPNIRFARGKAVHYYRMALPAFPTRATDHIGEWQAVVQLDYNAIREFRLPAKEFGQRYSIMVQANSNLNMKVNSFQGGYSPGTPIEIVADISQYGIPLGKAFDVTGRLTWPDGRVTKITLIPRGDGKYTHTIEDTSRPGAYTVQVLAAGATLDGTPTTREQVISAAVVIPGENRYSGDSTCRCGCKGSEHRHNFCRRVWWSLIRRRPLSVLDI